jgi:16S rRNA (adenine1518-N6/adenine1519-N6)-dimethyltransferase
MQEVRPKKSLGQHWLNDKKSLNAVIAAADLQPEDVVLEIGPGQGSLTDLLVDKVSAVIAVEIDKELAAHLSRQVPAGNLEVINENILEFDLSSMPPRYKVVANIPYYLTNNLLKVLSESANPPVAMALLVQKEVAERLAAQPGQMSLLSVSTQLYYQPRLKQIVPAKLFVPPPKVDSQIVALTWREEPLFDDLDEKLYLQIVKAGFAGRRKKLRSSLAAGLRISKPEADALLKKAGTDGDRRPQELSLPDWHKIYLAYGKK